jgi:hypothetical protein
MPIQSSKINLFEILSFLSPTEITSVMPAPETISNESFSTYGYDCLQQFCSLTGAPVAQILPSLSKSLIRKSYKDNDGDLEAIVDDLALRALTQCRPSPELVHLTPKAFIALPIYTQVAYLISRWLNPSSRLTQPGIDLLTIRRAQLRFWPILISNEIPEDILGLFHFRLLEVDASANLINIPPPPIGSLDRLISIKSFDEFKVYLNSLGHVWEAATHDYSNQAGNQLVKAAFLKSFINQSYNKPAKRTPTIVEIANKKRQEQHDKEIRFAASRERIMADPLLTPVQRARKLDLAKRSLGDLNELVILSSKVTTTQPKPISTSPRIAPRLNIFARKGPSE